MSGQVRVEPVQPLGPAHGRVDVDELVGFLAQEAPVPRRRHDGVDHDLGGADPRRGRHGLEEGGLHPVDVVVEVVQRRVERDHVICFLYRDAQLYTDKHSHWRRE